MRTSAILRAALLSSFVLPLFAAQAMAQGDPAGEAKAVELQKVADEALARKNASAAALKAEQDKLKALQTQLLKTKSEADQADRAGKQAEAGLKAQQDAVTKATTDKAAADKENEAPAKAVVDTAAALEAAKKAEADAKKAAEGAKGTDKEKETADAAAKAAEALKAATDAAAKATEAAKAPAAKVAAATKTLTDAQAAVKKSEEAIAKMKDSAAKSPEAIKGIEAQIAAALPVVEAAKTAFETVTAEWLGKQRAAENQLIALGKLVSFSHKIAPVFVKRCLACHNARTAKGRYNMENFAGVLKGGESGAPFEVGKAADSTLVSMLVSGDMPKDADPLTKEEIELVKKWIDTGAKLDAGFETNEPLFAIMPKVPQPPAPETYRVPVPITAIAFSPDGQQVATSGYHEVVLWNAADGKLARRVTNVAERVYDIAYSPDGKTMAVAAGTPAQMGELKLFDAASGALLADLVTSQDSVFACSWSPDGTKIACAGADRAIRIYNVATKKLIKAIEDHADWVMDVAWAPDGKKIASASRDKTSKVFDVEKGESLVTYNGHGQPVFGVQFLPSGNEVATSGADRQIRCWNVTNAQQTRAIGGFGNEVFRIRMMKDGNIYSASADQQARVHNATTGAVVKAFPGHKDWVYCVAYHEGTKKVAAGGYDGTVILWNNDDAKELVKFIAAPGVTPPAQAAK